MTRHGMQYPQLSAPVVYVDPLGEDNAAIITGLVGDGLDVHLTVFPADGEPTQVRGIAPERERGECDRWRWPEPTTIGG